MPSYLEGNILSPGPECAAQVAIVFGRMGAGEMALSWPDLAWGEPAFAHVRDPFERFKSRPVRASHGRWYWFIPSRLNHGLTDEQLREVFATVFAWAHGKELRAAISNGITNTDHTSDSLANRASIDRRARLMGELASEYERAYGMEISLIALNDAFVRNRTLECDSLAA